ncbi:putative leucine-rich repeat domain, L domain-containing protein [Rosa chinensis]|uniref:Putative leucine-rich repeat domain, L domain-containing protein n=1 Tax=Rosa chinensis TaxID=74649 RepID=A0A2P6Q5V5_ROSCH|nr:putative leucine-rich repeat domain, L domain-containing protein [Rosa chinensis]
MHGLRHLQLFGNKLTDDGLRSILDCCPDLGSLDLHHCFILNMEGDLRRICDERIEKLRLPHDSTEGKEFVARSEAYCFKWTELPDDVTALILSQLGGIDILTSAQKMKDFVKWLQNFRCWRTLIDLSIHEDISHESLALVGRSCPLLKSLKFNKRWFDEGRYNNRYKLERNDYALAIAGTMHALHHLMLFRNTLTNKGLCAILDGCPHLEPLDMRQCFNLRLGGKVGRRCAEQIKELRLPHDSVDDIDPSYQFVFDQ